MLIGYDFNSTATDLSEVTVVAANVSASQLTSPMDIAYTSTIGDNTGLDADGIAFGDASVLGAVGIAVNDATTTTFDDAVAGDDYLTFTVTPAQGYQMSLSSLSFKAAMKSVDSVDQYAVADANGNLLGNSVIVTDIVDTLATACDGFVVDLSSSGLQQLTEPIELRIYAWGRGTSTTTNTLTVLDKVVLHGSVEDTILVGYDFDAGESAAVVSSADLTASALTSPMEIDYSTGVGDDSGVDGYGAGFGDVFTLGAVSIGVDDASADSFAGAVAANDYISFTLTPNSEFGMQLSSINFKATKEAETSVDEYAITDAEGNLIGSATSITTVIGLTGAYESVSVELSGTEFEYLTDATEFRIYAWGRGTTSTVDSLALIDKITVHGDTFAMGSDFYVATDGDDANSGTLGYPLASIQQAINMSGPGSTLYLRGGNYHEEIDLSGVSGIPGYPITLIPYDGESVTLDGTKPITSEWTLYEGNIYKTTLSEDITELFVGDKPMTLARFPNALVWSDEMWSARTKKLNDSGRGQIEGQDIVGEAGVSFDGCIGLFNFGNYETIMAYVSDHTAGENDFNYSPSAGIYRTSDYYFLEGGVGDAELVMLDIAQEWAYDETDKTLYLWAENDEDPNNLEISGKVQTFAITGDATTKYITIDNIDFFATAFEFNSSDGITIQNCDFRYHTSSNRAIGSITQAEHATISGSESDFCEDIVVYNNTFKYSVTAALVCAYLDTALIENNYFEDINYSCIQSAAVQTSPTLDLVLRRNTLINSGPYAGFRFTRSSISTESRPFIVEYNYAEKCSQLQEDGTAYYSAGGGIVDSIWRYNWAYDNYEIDYRFDGANNPLTGVYANIYRNVAVATQNKQVNQIGAAYKLKGDYHEIYNNIAVHARADFEISVEKGGNDNSQSFNNAGDKLSGADSESVAIPGIESNNYQGQFESRGMGLLLRDPYNFDFRPKADSVEIIDQGLAVSIDVLGESIAVSEDYTGEAPDVGAYEYGEANYIVPGYQSLQASFPYPADERVDALYDTELMWREGLNATSHKVYVGTDAEALSLVSNQTNNIYTPVNAWVNDQQYFWRIDSVSEDGSVVTGDVWTFTISDHIPKATSQRVQVVEDGSVAITLQGDDPDGVDLSYAVSSKPQYGSLSGTAPNLVYTPNDDFFGEDSFLYVTNNGTSDSMAAIVIVTVSPVDNDAPYFSLDKNELATASVGLSYTNSIAALATDPDETSLSFAIIDGPSWLSLSSGGTLSGTPTLEDLGINSWTVSVADSTGLIATATVEIRVVEGTLSQLNFTDLGTDFSANSLMVEDSSSDLTVIGAEDGNDFLYSIAYTGADYDGDLTNDTLEFDVRVKGWSGGTAETGLNVPGTTNQASATIGSNDAGVGVTSSTFVVGSSLMGNGESLEFILENLSVVLSDPEVAARVFSTGFTSARLEQTANTANSHQVVFGSGFGLYGIDFNTNVESDTLNVGKGALYVSSVVGDGTRSTSWGVANVDFGLEVEVIPAGSYTQWASAYGVEDISPVEDAESDGLVNLMEFAFGMDPNVNDANIVSLDGSSFTPGLPTVNLDFSPLQVKARFVRLVDSTASGISYTAQFSHDLNTWEDLDGSSAVRISGTSAANGYEAVELDYPIFLSNGRKAQFYRIQVNEIESDDTQL
jgi:hypothetical protein